MGTTPQKLCGETLTAWRKRMEYSKRQAAIVIGCSREAWAGWESGTQPVPRYIGLAMAALALGMTPYGDERTKAVNAE